MPVRWRHPLAAAAMAAAVSLRYEAWFFVALLIGYFLATRSPRVSRGDILIVATPAILFMASWLLFTSQWGFLPNTIIAQTSVDPTYKEAFGTQAPLTGIIADFWTGYLSLSLAVALLATAYAVKTVRREFLAVVLLAFFAAEVAWIVSGFGNPSGRYLYVTVPGMTILAGRAISDIAVFARRTAVKTRNDSRTSKAGAALAASLLILVVGATVFDARAITYPEQDPGLFTEAMQRAGVFLSDRPLPDGKLLLSESPIAAYMSGYPPGRMIGAAYLPDNATNATRFLQENVAYFVLVTVPWYKLRVLFPQLADGVSTPEFTLLYDASGPEYALGAHRVLVYEVVPLPTGV